MMKMKTFNNIGEMSPYYNERTNTYEFYGNGGFLDIEIKFNLDIRSHIVARDIKARSINVVGDINAHNINAWDITVDNINAHDIKAWDINADNIEANNIEAYDIKAYDVNTEDIKAINIKANTIKANDIKFYAVCYAYSGFECKSIEGKRWNAKYFCLDSEVKVG